MAHIPEFQARRMREEQLYKDFQARMRAMRAPAMLDKVYEICVLAQANACGGRESDTQCAKAIGTIMGIIEAHREKEA